MTSSRRGSRVLSLMLGAFLTVPLAAQAQSPREHLQELTAQLQKAPADEALREKIIKLALTLHPKPSIPDAELLAEGAAEYAFKNAQSASGYSDSARQYEKALLIAPWIAADYFNCGVAYEKAGDNNNAIRNFNLYSLAAPTADDLQVVKKRIGGLQYAAQKVQSATNEPTRPLPRQDGAYAGLDGGVWRVTTIYSHNYNNGATWPKQDFTDPLFIEIHGNKISNYYGQPGGRHLEDIVASSMFDSRVFEVTGTDGEKYKFAISGDGKAIVVEEWAMPQPSMYRKSEYQRIN